MATVFNKTFVNIYVLDTFTIHRLITERYLFFFQHQLIYDKLVVVK